MTATLSMRGCRGMNEREASIPPHGKVRIPEALDRLIELYTVTDKPNEVQKWQAERANYPSATPRDRPETDQTGTSTDQTDQTGTSTWEHRKTEDRPDRHLDLGTSQDRSQIQNFADTGLEYS